MEIEALRVVVKVAETGSFTQAAAQLGVSKSRVSQIVIDLEAELGAKLFQRTTRMVQPTADGEQLVGRARRLVAEADEIAALFEGPRNLRGRVRVDLPTSVARATIIPRLPELLALHPLLEIDLSASDRHVDVRREAFDVVLRVGAVGEPSLTALRLGTMKLVNCVSPSYAQTYGLPRTIEELSQHVIVNYATTMSSGATFEYEHDGVTHEVPMRAFVTVNDIDALRAACVAGLGIAQVATYGVRAQLARGELIEVLPEHRCAPMPVALVHAHGRQVPKRVRAVMSWLASLCEPLVSD